MDRKDELARLLMEGQSPYQSPAMSLSMPGGGGILSQPMSGAAFEGGAQPFNAMGFAPQGQAVDPQQQMTADEIDRLMMARQNAAGAMNFLRGQPEAAPGVAQMPDGQGMNFAGPKGPQWNDNQYQQWWNRAQQGMG